MMVLFPWLLEMHRMWVCALPAVTALCYYCVEEEATSHLLNLSPYELKNFLYHILSAKDFVVLEGWLVYHMLSAKNFIVL